MAMPIDINELPSEISFVTPEKVRSAKLPYNSAYGPDGVIVSDLNKISIRARCKLFSTLLLLRWIPSYVLDSRTMFLPKKQVSTSPADLRPISISSVLSRLFHKILASRLSTII